MRQEITNESVLSEVRSRTQFVEALLSEQKPPVASQSLVTKSEGDLANDSEESLEPPAERRPLPSIRVYDYEQLLQEHGSI